MRRKRRDMFFSQVSSEFSCFSWTMMPLEHMCHYRSARQKEHFTRSATHCFLTSQMIRITPTSTNTSMHLPTWQWWLKMEGFLAQLDNSANSGPNEEQSVMMCLGISQWWCSLIQEWVMMVLPSHSTRPGPMFIYGRVVAPPSNIRLITNHPRSP